MMHQQGLSVDYESTNNKLRTRETVKGMVCHSDCVSSSEATTCNYDFFESEFWVIF